MSIKTLLMLFVSLSFIVGLPVLGWWARRDMAPHCALDGLRVSPLYRVRVVDAVGATHEFCCVRCAATWLARQPSTPSPRHTFVTDEATGTEIDAEAAYFAASPVTTNAVTGNRVHAFAARSAAEEHVRAFGGAILSGTDKPLGIRTPPEPAPLGPSPSGGKGNP